MCEIENTIIIVIYPQYASNPNLNNKYDIGRAINPNPSTIPWYNFTFPCACTIVVIGFDNDRIKAYIIDNRTNNTIYGEMLPSHKVSTSSVLIVKGRIIIAMKR